MNLQGASATVVADTIEAALKDHGAEFDAAVICTPLAQRQAASKLAAEANKHLLLDSPISTSFAEAEAVIDACEQAAVRFTIGRTLRFTPSSRTILDGLSSGKLGDPSTRRRE